MALLRTALVALLLAGCDEKPPGRKLAPGIAQRLTVHDGHVAFLLDAVHPDDRAVPEDLTAGDLWLDDQKAGSGVSSQPGMFAFSRSGRLAYLASWRFRAGEGELWTAAPQPVLVAKSARSFAWSPDGATLAYVAPGRLGIGARTVPIEGLQELAWAPDGKRIAARTSSSSGGKLFLVEVASGGAREIAPGTSDFAFASDGAIAALGPPPPKGGDRPLLLDSAGLAAKEIARATAFTFSPDGRELALLSTAKQPGEATGDLFRLSRGGGEPRLVAQKASDWRWGAPGDLLCLARYDLRARAGVLTLSSGDGPPREIAPKVQAYVVQGRRVLYLVQAPQKGDFKIELWGVDLGTGAAPHKIDEGVYGWDLSGDTLFYKARCAGGPRSCSLLRTSFAAAAPPTLLSPNVAGFDLSQDGSRILVQQPHRGATRAVDLSVIAAQAPPPEHLKILVEEADAGSRFADPAGRQLVYALLAAGRGGVFIADLP